MSNTTSDDERLLKKYDLWHLSNADRKAVLWAITQKVNEAEQGILMGFRKRDFVREDFYKSAVIDRLKQLKEK